MKKLIFTLSVVVSTSCVFANNNPSQSSLKKEGNKDGLVLKTKKTINEDFSNKKKIQIKETKDPFTDCVNSNTIVLGVFFNYDFELGNAMAIAVCYNTFKDF